MLKKIPVYILSICLLNSTFGQTIEEKEYSFIENAKSLIVTEKEGLQLKMNGKKSQLSTLYEDIEQQIETNSNLQDIESTTLAIQKVAKEIRQLELEWKEIQKQDHSLDSVIISKEQIDLYDFIHEYSSTDHIYLIPQELRDIKLNISSKLPIPQGYWDELLDIILHENNIEIESLSPFIKRLYISKEKHFSTFHFINSLEELKKLPHNIRAGFYYSIPENHLPHIEEHFSQIINDQQCKKINLDNGIIIFSHVKELLSFQQFIDFITVNSPEKSCRILNIAPLSFDEFQKLTSSMFCKKESKRAKAESIALKHSKQTALVVAQENDLDAIDTLLKKIKNQSQKEVEKKLFFINCKHTEVKEIAPLINDFFRIMKQENNISTASISEATAPTSYQDFTIDPKTNSIVGYCDEPTRVSLQQLVNKIDQPNLMVNIDVLLFEKKIENNNEIGLSHLSMGSIASHTNKSSFEFSNENHQGIHDLIFKKASLNNFPAIDLAYKLVMSQKNLQINANPSLLTCNKKPASISIVDEISINTGYSHKGRMSKSYDRKEVGIRIEVTPVVQIPTENYQEPYITLSCNIHFDSPKTLGELPNISKRSIKNEIRVKNGDTIILGGLKRKTKDLLKGEIPFVSKIPIAGYLFKSEEDLAENTEMFICLTPKVVDDQYWKELSDKRAEKKKRPGDTKELLEILRNYHNKRKKTSPQITLLEDYE
ncbi:MAG: hypothetical protein L7U87_04340 [Chlamydiales bacterium]|nr:hypothetical protein [Chlamydiales bacterium]